MCFSGRTKHSHSLDDTSSGKATKQAIDEATQELDCVTSSLRQADVAISILKDFESRTTAQLQQALEHFPVASTDYDTLLRILEHVEQTPARI